MRRAIPLALLAWGLVLLTAGCGQKSGVAFSQPGPGDVGQVLVGPQGAPAPAPSSADAGVAPGTTSATPATRPPGTSAAAPPSRSRPTAAGPAATNGRGAGGGAPAAGGAPDRTGINDKEIVIGIHAPVTGAAPLEQRTFELGKDVYWKFTNAEKGGTLGRQVRVVFRNDEFNPVRARQVCQEMAEKDRAFLLVGGAGADQITSCAQYANSVGIPYLSAGVNTRGLNGLKTYFAVSQTYAQQAPLLAQLVRKRPAPSQGPTDTFARSNVGLVVLDTPSFEDARTSAVEAFRAEGLTVVADQTVSKTAGQSEIDAVAAKMKDAKAGTVFLLTSPTLFLNLSKSATGQAYTPWYVGPGITNGLNLVAQVGCPDIGPAQFLSPFPQLDVIDALDPDFRPAYQRYVTNANPGQRPDDIGIALWGLAKTIREMFLAAGNDVSRQSLIAVLEGGTEFRSNVYPPVRYGPGRHLGGTASHLLRADCTERSFKTAAQFATGF